MTRGELLSSPNLVHAGRMTPGSNLAAAWHLDNFDDAVEAQPVDRIDELGQPRALFAARVPRRARLIQNIEIGSRGQHVLRVTARGRDTTAKLRLSIRLIGHDSIMREASFTLDDRWLRCRMDLILPTDGLQLALEIAGDDGEIDVTDVRFARLGEARPCSLRFETRGSVLLPSTRLRALMLEDYLDFIGCQARVNAGSDYDVLVCQKTTPWLHMIVARLLKRRVVFDMDDDELAEGLFRRLRVSLFARCANQVTVGSERLLEKFARYSRHVTLLENPVDILDPALSRGQTPWRNRLVWFGMPENLWMLDDLKLKTQVTTITRGGDIEFDLLTIDRNLVEQDLALLPVTMNDHTRAKNANRLVKCAALGLPFLASDTPEHRRALDRVGLEHTCLVAEGDDWSQRITAFAQDYEKHLSVIAAARPAVQAEYGIEAIVSCWLHERPRHTRTGHTNE